MTQILDPYFGVLKNWNKMKGTLDRRTYWTAILTALVILWILIWFASKIAALSIVAELFCVIMLVPFFTATVRRLHDVNKTGWFLLFGLIPVIGALTIFVYVIQNSEK